MQLPRTRDEVDDGETHFKHFLLQRLFVSCVNPEQRYVAEQAEERDAAADCFATKLLVEPVVDDWVAEVVDVAQIHPFVVETEDVNQSYSRKRQDETNCDDAEHLHDENVLRSRLLNGFLR